MSNNNATLEYLWSRILQQCEEAAEIGSKRYFDNKEVTLSIAPDGRLALTEVPTVRYLDIDIKLNKPADSTLLDPVEYAIYLFADRVIDTVNEEEGHKLLDKDASTRDWVAACVRKVVAWHRRHTKDRYAVNELLLQREADLHASTVQHVRLIHRETGTAITDTLKAYGPGCYDQPKENTDG